MPPILNSLISWWSGYYGDHQVISVSIRFLHMAGLVLGGGTGLFLDRQVLQAARTGTKAPEAVLSSLSKTHKYVISWILVVGLTGVLMTASDTYTFLSSSVFWIKMIVVSLLIGNGAALLFLERRAARRGDSAVWPHLIIVSTLSAVLWLTALFMGILLTVAA